MSTSGLSEPPIRVVYKPADYADTWNMKMSEHSGQSLDRHSGHVGSAEAHCPDYATSDGPLRIYRVRGGLAPICLATCGADSLGFALMTLAEEGEFDGWRVGIMHRPDPQQQGNWIINPYEENHAH